MKRNFAFSDGNEEFNLGFRESEEAQIEFREQNLSSSFDFEGDEESELIVHDENLCVPISFSDLIIKHDGGGGDPYEGRYRVIPNFNTQTLYTKEKVMKDNVTVEKIPVYEVDNKFGGKTVTIGEIL